MDKLTKTNEIEQVKAELEPTLCKQCLEFFGDQTKENLCSKCFREKNCSSPTKDEKTYSNTSIENEAKIEEIAKKPIKEDHQNQQIDTSKCWKCSRKAGYLGFQCKCLFTYCKLHRLPEFHDCTYDFATEGKKKLIDANPVVKGNKLEKI